MIDPNMYKEKQFLFGILSKKLRVTINWKSLRPKQSFVASIPVVVRAVVNVNGGGGADALRGRGLARLLPLLVAEREKVVVFVGCSQGDQMNSRKNRPKCSPTHLLSKLIHNFLPRKK
jgi:hypothetical protein